jgi:two-component system NtrC family response regulator
VSPDHEPIYNAPVPARIKTLLIVDADPATRGRLSGGLERHYRVLAAASAEAALAVLAREEADLLLIDAVLPGISGLEMLRIVRENYAVAQAVMVSAEGRVQAAVEAVKEGAYHFLPKDCALDELLAVLRNASDHQDLDRQVLALSAQVADAEREFIVGPSRAMRGVMELMGRIAKLSATVLVLGESGTGKELIARLMHREGARPEGPFIPVNLAAIPRELVESTLFGHEKGSFTGAYRQQLGKFELAAGGTLFLDEIGDLRHDLQGKLLRAIQEGEIERVGGAHPIRTDFRLITATNVDLEKCVKEGRFREDLYYRLNVIPIRMPPLRERTEDVPELAACFVRRYAQRFRRGVKGFTPGAMKRLQAHWWPGNIRELENLVERLVAITEGEWIGEDDLPLDYQVPASLPDAGDEPADRKLLQHACESFERSFILKALERAGWNVTAAARHLGIPLSTMKHKMDRLAIRPLAKRLRAPQ